MGFLVLIVGQACNFRCMDCANFAPISPDKFKRYDVEEIKDNLSIILKNVDFLENVQIQGGEPFLYSDLGMLVEWLRSKNVRNIVIATNGSIVPQHEMLQQLKDNNILVRISNYGLSTQRNTLVEKLNYYGIAWNEYYFANNNSYWYYCGGKDMQKETSFLRWIIRYNKCKFSRCYTLERNEISKCSRSTNSWCIQGFERKKGDYLLVEDIPEFSKKLKKYLKSRYPMEACRYCYGTSEKHLIKPAVQMKSFE